MHVLAAYWLANAFILVRALWHALFLFFLMLRVCIPALETCFVIKIYSGLMMGITTLQYSILEINTKKVVV